MKGRQRWWPVSMYACLTVQVLPRLLLFHSAVWWLIIDAVSSNQSVALNGTFLSCSIAISCCSWCCQRGQTFAERLKWEKDTTNDDMPIRSERTSSSVLREQDKSARTVNEKKEREREWMCVCQRKRAMRTVQQFHFPFTVTSECCGQWTTSVAVFSPLFFLFPILYKRSIE